MATHRQVPAGPSARELRAIEAEWPVIAAEVAVVEVECRMAAGRWDELIARAHRRAVGKCLVVLTAYANAEAAGRAPHGGRDESGSVVELPVPVDVGRDELVSRIGCDANESIEGAS
ncbi:MAG: DUF6284 family protein [Nocardioides sp.]